MAEELGYAGHQVSRQLVSDLLHQIGYSLQANRKRIEGTRRPDRAAQFQYINGRTRAFLRTGHPLISVDTKKKELVGNFKTAGRELRFRRHPEKVMVHDFVLLELGQAIPLRRRPEQTAAG